MKVFISVGKIKNMLFFSTVFSNSEILENEMQQGAFSKEIVFLFPDRGKMRMNNLTNVTAV